LPILPRRLVNDVFAPEELRGILTKWSGTDRSPDNRGW